MYECEMQKTEIKTLVELKLKTVTAATTKYKFLEKEKESLNKIKEKYGKQYLIHSHILFMKYFDHYNDLRFLIMKKFNIKYVSNAWLKCYELVSEFKLMNKSTLKSFSNGEFPGSFILAMNFYMEQHYPLIKYEWRAASLIGGDAFTDDYGLQRDNKKNWLMDEKNNGDVTDINNLLDFKKKLFNEGEQIDFYTSDLGMSSESDYGAQEEINMRAHLGAALSGLMILKKGGNFLVKQYTYFCGLTVSLIIIYSTMFEEFYISKPLTSKPTNSEIYLVGKGFIGMTQKIEDLLTNKLKNFNFGPLILKGNLPKEPLAELIDFLIKLIGRQEKYLDESIKLFNTYKNKINVFKNKMEPDKEKAISCWMEKYF